MPVLEETPQTRLRFIWYAIGVAMIAWGGYGLHSHTSTTSLLHVGRLFLIDVIGHDGVFAPIAFVVAFLTERIVPRALRTPLRIGLAVSAVLVLIALPDIKSPRRGHNGSVLPLDYNRNLAILLGAVLAGVVIAALAQSFRTARPRSRTPASPQQE